MHTERWKLEGCRETVTKREENKLVMMFDFLSVTFFFFFLTDKAKRQATKDG